MKILTKEPENPYPKSSPMYMAWELAMTEMVDVDFDEMMGRYIFDTISPGRKYRSLAEMPTPTQYLKEQLEKVKIIPK